MALEWKHTEDSVDWDELSALYKAAPLGDKKPTHLQKVFSNSLFKCFVYEDSKLIGAGRALADGADCSYICDIAVMKSPRIPSHTRQLGVLGHHHCSHMAYNSKVKLDAMANFL